MARLVYMLCCVGWATLFMLSAASSNATNATTTTTTHLFSPAVVDVTSTTGLVRTIGRGVKGGSPVLVVEHPWEDSFFFYHSVVVVDQVIWLYYASWTRSGAYVCLAQSTDGGDTFTKPNLGVVQFNGTSENNIVLKLSANTSGLVTLGAVFIDEHTVDPNARFKMTAEHPGNVGMDIWISPDGLHWRLEYPEALPAWFADTQPVVFWDESAGEYFAYGRLHAGTAPGTGTPRRCPAGPASMRQVGYSKSINANLTNWTPVKEIFGFADQPDCVDVYNNAAVQADNSYFLIPSEYRHFDPKVSHASSAGNDGILDVRLAVSSDGETFEYVSSDTFIDRGIGAIDPDAVGSDWHFHGEWDSGILFAVRGFAETNSTLVLFYWGTQATHGDYPTIFNYPQATSGIGKLTFRKHGWFSFDTTGAATGVLVTTAIAVPPQPSSATQLVVRLNVLSSVRGVVRLALLDPVTNVSIAGYDINSSIPLVAQNCLSAPLKWTPMDLQQPHSLGPMVKLRFEATYSKLFSFELDWIARPL
jgi:hypothetical protein